MATEREIDKLKDAIRRLGAGDKESLYKWLDEELDSAEGDAIRAELEKEHEAAEKADRERFASGRQDEMQQDA